MSRTSIVALTASLIMASPAFAAALYPDQPNGSHHSVTPGKKIKSKGGIVGGDGSIITGTGYSVSHDGTGEYTIDVPDGYFTDCPEILVTAAGNNGHAPIVNDYDYITCGQGEVKMQIRIWSRTDGSAQDNAFHFLMIDP
ncbi:MAG TPA: hypothetical protein VHY79_13640 [Rhizomicrobium sp.]|jgi:hypothetical protein|nr:hypothetical protein [Rhizomicrobium sp.]